MVTVKVTEPRVSLSEANRAIRGVVQVAITMGRLCPVSTIDYTDGV